MARVYHSASSDDLGQRCRRRWWYEYREKRRRPDLTWADACKVRIEGKPRRPLTTVEQGPDGRWTARITDAPGIAVTVKAKADAIDRATLMFYLLRSTALGGEVHDRLEGWYQGLPTNWRDLPGKIAESGLCFLPDPDECRTIRTESEIGAVDLPKDPRPGALRRAFAYGGVLWGGKRDLLAELGGKAWRRLGFSGPRRWALYDYKTTKRIHPTANEEGYAKSPEQLAADIQANVYGLATCAELDLRSVPARWVYFETKDSRRSAEIPVLLERARCEDVVGVASERSKSLDAMQSIDDAEQNPQACADYGGCPHHVTAGGPCDARQSVGLLIQPRIIRKVDSNMAGLKKENADKLAAFKKTAKAAAVEETVDAAEPAVEAPKKRRSKKAAEPVEEMPDARVDGDLRRTRHIDGDHGTITIEADARDLLDILELIDSKAD